MRIAHNRPRAEIADAPPAGFEVAGWIHRLGAHVAHHPAFWIRLGNLETRLIAEKIADVTVDRPAYIAGLARAGSTILLEVLARHPEVATHRYRDYPPVFTPYLWNRWLDLVPRKAERPAERTHKDGIAVTSESPEAFEEVLWMAFFSGLHDPGRNAVLSREALNPPFEEFYRDHIRKLLAARGRSRYVSKDNYNITRLGYIHRLFPRARFIIPVRNPVWHVASLMKQHDLFLRGQRHNPRALLHLQRVGHFEFGLDRRAINCGDDNVQAKVLEHWRKGEEVLGWAHYWAITHDHVANLLERDVALEAASLVVRYEDLCTDAHGTIARVLDHCGLEPTPRFIEREAAGIRFPGYYRPAFTDAEITTIRSITADAAARFGYGSPSERMSTAGP